MGKSPVFFFYFTSSPSPNFGIDLFHFSSRGFLFFPFFHIQNFPHLIKKNETARGSFVISFFLSAIPIFGQICWCSIPLGNWHLGRPAFDISSVGEDLVCQSTD
jgi:hypothetical protein